MSKEDVLQQIAKMIASGEIPKEIYDKYLGKCPIGFMSEETLFNFLKQDNREQKLIKYLEDKINNFKLKGCVYEKTYICGKVTAYKDILERVKSGKYD